MQRAEMLTTEVLTDLPPDQAQLVLEAWLEGWVIANVFYLQNHPGTPSILDPAAGIRYVPQPYEAQRWFGRGALAELREGDCKILPAVWVAEELMRGREARCIVRWAYDEDQRVVFHVSAVEVQPDGTEEETDVCRLLGMGEDFTATHYATH